MGKQSLGARKRMVIGVGVLLAAAHGAASAGGLDGDSSLSLRRGLLEDASARSILNGTNEDALSVNAMIQFRYIADVQDQVDTQDELTIGFVNSRTRVGFKGSLADKKLSYFVWTGFGATGSSFPIDAWAKWQATDDLTIRAGQFKLTTWQEWTVAETKQTAIERSVLDARFAQGYSQGIEAVWTRENIRLTGAFSDGLRTFNTASLGTRWAATARAELLLDGEWSQREDFQSFRDESSFAVVGIAGHYQDGGTITGLGGSNIYSNDTRITQWTADAQWGWGGGSLFGAIIGNHEERPGGAEFDQIGVLIQGQVFVTDDIEVFARYEWGDLDGEAASFAALNPGASTNDDLSILTVGVTKFLAGHALKLTADAGVAFDEVSGAWRGGGRGWQGDDAGADTQVVFRAQMQAIF